MASAKSGPDWLDARIRAGEVIVIDGGTGTELEARGARMDKDAWCAIAVLEHGDLAQQVHGAFIAAGAEVIIANTFSAGRHMLEPAGYGDRVAEINRLAVEHAKAARDRAAGGPVAIAGSVSHFITPGHEADWGSEKRLRATYREQVEIQAEAGVDLFALEMMYRLDRVLPAIEEAQATGLPVWVGISCATNDQGQLAGFLAPEEDTETVVKAIAATEPGLVAVMHSSINDTNAALELVARHWQGPVGAYPESGYFEMPHWQFVDVIAPDDLVKVGRDWVAAGVQVVGGCCGIGADHIRHLKAGLPKSL